MSSYFPYTTLFRSFGAFFLAATEEGFCRASFIFNNDLSPEFEYLKKRWLNASFQQDDAWAQQNIDQWFQLKAQVPQKPIQLHIVGTHSQLEVWQALRSEERRVGKECRSWWSPVDDK